MKRITGILYFILFVVVGGCFEPPQFSTTPTIEFDNVRVKNIADPTQPDSLIISIGFKDGDGDIGIDPSENGPPFNERWYFLTTPSPTCETGVLAPCTKISYVDQAKLNNYITYKLKRAGAPYDTLPAFVKPYDCENYVVLRNSNNQAIDTVYSQLNKRYFNLYVDVDIKISASYQPYVFNQAPYPNCDIYGINARIPVLAKDGNFDSKLPLDGVIHYKLTSASFTPLIGKTLRLRARLLDREGHISKEATSEDFSFN